MTLNRFATTPVLCTQTLRVLKSLEKPSDKVSFLNDLIDTFTRETPDILRQLLAAVKNRNLAGFRHYAHELKGLAGNIGVLRLMALADYLESLAEGSVLPDAEELKNVLESYRFEAINCLNSDWKR